MDSTSYLQLGKTDFQISPIGLGTMQWGSFPMPDMNDRQPAQNVRAIYQVSLDLGINLFDTAEIYGNGRSERYLGMNLIEKPGGSIIATKFMPFPWRVSKGELRNALIKSLHRLGLKYIELYQMHWPFPPVPIKTWMEAMADVYADGLIRAVGVSNYSILQTDMAQTNLAKYQLPLASNQIKYSLLDRRPERSGLVDYCSKSGITVIAYSPLEKGMLTGKYSSTNIPTGFRAWRYNKSFLTKIEPLLHELREIGKQHQDKTPGQVALNWLVTKGAVPIPGARDANQAKENAGAMGWKLTPGEIEKLDRISSNLA